MFSLLPGIRRAMQVFLAVLVVNQTFTLGDVDLRAYLLIDHRHVCFFFCVFNFHK